MPESTPGPRYAVPDDLGIRAVFDFVERRPLKLEEVIDRLNQGEALRLETERRDRAARDLIASALDQAPTP